MILYPPLVGVACGELGLLYPLPQAAKNNRAPSTSRQNLAASICLEEFLCIFDSPFLKWNKLTMVKAALLSVWTNLSLCAFEFVQNDSTKNS